MALSPVGCYQISGYRKRLRFVFQVAMDLVRNATAVAQVDDVDSELIADPNLVLKKKAHVPAPDLFPILRAVCRSDAVLGHGCLCLVERSKPQVDIRGQLQVEIWDIGRPRPRKAGQVSTLGTCPWVIGSPPPNNLSRASVCGQDLERDLHGIADTSARRWPHLRSALGRQFIDQIEHTPL